MRILHVTQVVHPSAGGPPTVAINLAAAQARLGHSVAVIGYYPESDESTTLDMFKNIPFEAEIERHLLPQKSRLKAIVGRDFRSMFRGLLAEADIVVAHGLWDNAIVHAARMARKARVPYVIRTAGMLDPWSLKQKYWKKLLGMRLMFGSILRDAAFIHTTSQYEASHVERLIDRLGYSTPVRMIHNGIFLRDIESLPGSGSAFTNHPELGHNPYVLFLGRMHHKKRPDVLVKAFAEIATRFPRLQLVLAGPDFGETEKMRALAAGLGLANRVHLPGPIYGREKFELLVDAACFCLPSEQENFGVAVAEAMAAGTPVVVSDQVQIWPEIENAGAGFAAAIQVGAVAESLTRILEDDDRRIKMGKAGRKLVEEVFLWRNIAKVAVEYYTQVQTRERPAPSFQSVLA